MTTKPLLSKAFEVVNLLAGRQEVIVRPMKMAPLRITYEDSRFFGESGREYKAPWQPGDILLVKEAWQWCDDGVDQFGDDAPPQYIYRESYPTDFNANEFDFAKASELKWRSPVHMPESAARIWLRVTSVKAVRCQDVTQEEAVKVGLSKITKDGGRTWKFGLADKDGYPGTDDIGWPWSEWDVDYKKALAKLHILRYGQESWDKNEWLWWAAVEVLSTTGNPSSISEPVSVAA